MADLFKRASGLATGYDVGEVDEFFDRAQKAYEQQAGITVQTVRSVTFTRRQRGYKDTEVDAALDRLESVLSRKERDDFIAKNGQKAWMDRVSVRATSLYERLTRPAGRKFAPGQSGDISYDPREVDTLCDRLVSFFNESVPLSSDEVRRATFATTHGKKGYATAPVDAFFSKSIEVLAAVE